VKSVILLAEIPRCLRPVRLRGRRREPPEQRVPAAPPELVRRPLGELLRPLRGCGHPVRLQRRLRLQEVRTSRSEACN